MLCSPKKDVLNLGEHVLVSKTYGEISEISNRFYILAVGVLRVKDGPYKHYSQSLEPRDPHADIMCKVTSK